MNLRPLLFSITSLAAGILSPACREQDPVAALSPNPSATTGALNGNAVTDLGTLGGTNSQATAVNDSNLVVGLSQTADGSTHAFLWHGGQMTDLGTLGGSSSQADDINSLGQVVGRSTTAAGETHAFLWNAGVMHDLGPAFPRKVLVNEQGQVAWTDPSTPSHGFLWTNGTTQDLGSLGGRTVVTALNNGGDVVGFSAIDQGTQHAFLWRSGTMIDLGSLGGSSEADDINASGQVVGTAYAPVGAPPDVEFIGHAIMWDNGQLIDLGTPAGDVHSGAVAINERHQTAANSFPRSFFPAHAFQWDRGVATPLSSTYQTDQFEFFLAGIDNQDIIAGTQKSISTFIPRAVVWSGGTTVRLATLGGPSSFSNAINQTGAVVGWAQTASGATHAALWQVTRSPITSGSPGTVTDLAVTGMTSTTATVSFTEVDDGTGQPAQYDVRYAPSPISWGSATDAAQGTCATPLAGTTIGAQRTCTVESLSPSMSYDFQLVAYRGTLNVNAVFGGLSNVATGSTTSTATALPVATVSVSPSAATGNVGDAAQFTATTQDANGNVLTGRTVSWSSTNTAVVTVNATGYATAVGAGSAALVATSEGKSGQARITVNGSAPTPLRVAMSP